MRRSRQVIDLIRPIEAGVEALKLGEVREILREWPAHTLLPMEFFTAVTQALDIRREVLARGDWVQVGVWRGGGALFFRALMEDFGLRRALHLVDTFSAIPVDHLTRERDRHFVKVMGLQSGDQQSGDYLPDVERLFSEQRLDEGVIFHPCDVTRAGDLPVEEISFLHVDVDFYEPTLAALEMLYDRVVPGGVIVLDDYYADFLDCRRAVEDFLERRGVIAESALERLSCYSALMVKE